MLRLVVHEDARELGIVHPVACLFENVTITSDSPALDPSVERLTEEAQTALDSKLSLPEVRGFRELFRRMGYPDLVPAGEKLLRLIAQRGLRRYNNVVDAYNIASARFGSGLGLHDATLLREVGCPVEVYRANGEEKILPLFKTKPVRVSKNDLVYGFTIEGRSQLLAWLGKIDVDSDDFRVRENSRDLLLIVLGNAVTSEDYNRTIGQFVFELLQKTGPAVAMVFLAVSSHSEFSDRVK